MNIFHFISVQVLHKRVRGGVRVKVAADMLTRGEGGQNFGKSAYVILKRSLNLMLDPSHKDIFYQHLNSANLNIEWTKPAWTELNNFGLKADYLDLLIKIENGFIEVEDYSRSDHNYISRSSCYHVG